LDDNIYIRAGEPVDVFATWSPAKGVNCTAQYETLDKFQQANPQFEKHSRYLGTVTAPFSKARSWEIMT